MVKLCVITMNKCIGDIETGKLCDTCEIGLSKEVFNKSYILGKKAYHNNINTPHIDPEMYKIHNNLSRLMVSMLRDNWLRGYDNQMKDVKI